jgi:hypothetical protein
MCDSGSARFVTPSRATPLLVARKQVVQPDSGSARDTDKACANEVFGRGFDPRETRASIGGHLGPFRRGSQRLVSRSTDATAVVPRHAADR